MTIWSTICSLTLAGGSWVKECTCVDEESAVLSAVYYADTTREEREKKATHPELNAPTPTKSKKQQLLHPPSPPVTQFINIVFTLMHCTCLHILQTMRFSQISFPASCSDHSGEEPGSGLEQCSLCVSCPQVAKRLSCSFSGDQLLQVMFHINLLSGNISFKRDTFNLHYR